MPATCVPWKEALRSSGSLPRAPEPGPGKPRAAITLGVVNAGWPFGKPGGYAYPFGLKNGFRWSTPSSTTPILTPAPVIPVAAVNAGAPIRAGLRFNAIR